MIQIERLRAYLRLHLAEGIGATLFHRIVEAVGDVERAAAPGGIVQGVSRC